MIFKILLIVVGFQQVEVGNKILDQAELYISNIEQGIEVEYNYWSLAEIYFENCEYTPLKRLISSSKSSTIKQGFAKFSCHSITKEEKREQIIEFAIDQKLPGIVAIILIESDSAAIINKGMSFLDSAIPLLENQPEEIKFFNALVDNEKFYYQDIPIRIRELVFYSILFNYKVDELLFDNIDLTFVANYQTDLLSKPTKNSTSLSFHLANLIFIQFNLSTYGNFLDYQFYILDDKSFPNTLEKIRHLKALAYGFYATGRYDKALELHRFVIQPLAQFYENKPEQDDTKLIQATNLFSLGKFNEAKILFEQLYNDPTAQVDRATLFNNLSLCYFRLGQKNRYVSYLLEALDEATSSNSYSNNLTILRNLFFYYSSIGDQSTALEYLELAKQIARNNNDKYQLAVLRAFTGIYYWKTENDIVGALSELNEATKDFDPNSDFFDFFRIQISISEIYLELDSLSRAKEILTNLSELAAKNSLQNEYLEATIGSLEISILEYDLTTASNYIQDISLYSLNNLGFKPLIKYNIQLAEYQFLSGDDRLAYQNLRPVIDQVIERARTSIDTQTGYWVQEDEYIDAFNSLLNILIATGNDYEAIQLLDEIKTINDAALYNSPILRAKRLSEEDLAKDQLLNSQITSLRESFLHANNVSERLEIKNEIDQLSAEREEILNKIRQDGVIDKSPIWLIQQSLSENEQIIHFTEVGDYLYVSYLTSNTIEIHKLEFESSEKALFDSVADQIALSKTNLVDLFEIYDFLGLNKHLSTSKGSLIVIPDNYLYRIPLEILPITNPVNASSYGSTTYLIEEYQTEYFASLKEYQDLNRAFSTSFTSELAAFAISDFSDFDESYLPTLPFAAQEIRTISEKLYAFDDKNLFLEGEATKSNFLDEVVSSKIVHIATHSEVSEQDPLFSTIYLNDNNTESSVNALYAYELFERRLNNDLIMLNSCSSGSGDYLQGSGIMGITRALRYAGAKSMALNLWAVNDKVAYEFASVFYESLNAGYSKSQAMRDAKIHLLQNGNANPHYWGAFMLTGDPSPIIKRPDNAGLVLPILIVMIGSISIFIRRNKTI